MAARSRIRHKATDIEKLVSSCLREQGFYYKREHRLDNYHVDFYLPHFNLSIQADSTYWHGGCNCCRVKGLTARQRFQRHRDRACLTYHRYRRINILRICECVIKDKTALVNLIKTSIEKIENGEYVNVGS